MNVQGGHYWGVYLKLAEFSLDDSDLKIFKVVI